MKLLLEGENHNMINMIFLPYAAKISLMLRWKNVADNGYKIVRRMLNPFGNNIGNIDGIFSVIKRCKEHENKK